MLLGLGAIIQRLAEQVEDGDNPFSQTRTVYAFGSNTAEQLGPSEPVGDNKPRVVVKVMEEVDVLGISQNGGNSLTQGCAILLDDNRIYSWGGPSAYLGRSGSVWPPAPLEGDTWIAVSQVDEGILALRDDQTLHVIGNGSRYRLGTGSASDVTSFQQIASNITAIAGGRYYGHIVNTAGDVLSFGENSTGQTARGTTSGYTMTPTVVVGNTSNGAKITASTNTAFYITDTGDLYGCGSNGAGKNALPTTTGSQVSYHYISGGWRHISCGDAHAVGVKDDNTLWGFGSNGTIGTMIANGPTAVTPDTQLHPDAVWLDAYATRNGTIARKLDGRLYYTGGSYIWGEVDNQDFVHFGTIAPTDLIGNGGRAVIIGRR